MTKSKYLVCYDIVSNKKRTKVYKKLKDYGTPVQKSVFECILGIAQVELMWKEISPLIDENTDIITLYRLDRIEQTCIKNLGFYIPHEEDDELIFV